MQSTLVSTFAHSLAEVHTHTRLLRYIHTLARSMQIVFPYSVQYQSNKRNNASPSQVQNILNHAGVMHAVMLFLLHPHTPTILSLDPGKTV
jgi:hypothetical protein